MTKTTTLMSLNGGYVDTAGFLAMHGLFTAHVTGNFVTFGAALAQGSSGALTKLLALPVFCSVVVLSQIASIRLLRSGKPVLSMMLITKTLLLVIGACLAIGYGPFPVGDTWPLFLTGMSLVAAMAIQNAVHRVHLSSAPPTTLMTGTTTQIMLDLAELMGGSVDESKRATVRARIAKLTPSLLAFAIGCLIAAGLFMLVGMWCFLVPPSMSAIVFFVHRAERLATA
ncbi:MULTISPECIES: YoaK family protein [Rhizobium/Agrobacterium group]|uniref:YoaK family protein n=1 Tax=Rhizobium/Agrobacterium group TaxID=227290 RepID=UPI0015716FD4|nr:MULTISPECIES: YoaK family protein [Rhizobium/Agrobacterium group]NTC82504.1 DUF1275 domain-containing protein [Agrobacterium tumefaciens]NTD11327.1 DUF1275 domain-containing protein [Agrobacterium tumefaciens]NTD86805.1 DUF1275 domain-containing protein [Agrobacterium tumefaciens]NTD93030.1 DUF1275 domain-containing protein [Agrobacterium tumefaciens]NTE00721.1 DUF1275 domain-containing protein [Agrobacterium tumefaciens]